MNPLAAALISLPDDTRRLIVAFSGGRDSTALLHALSRAGHAQPLLAVHVCHHLQPQAERWATFCAERCQALGVAYRRLDVAVDTRQGGEEAAARHARYEALAALMCPGDVVLTAHHADDQSQTVLLQALRGAGVRGLAGMPAITRLGAGRLWRPWLTMSRSAITRFVDDAHLCWIDDPSNDDPQRDRGYLDTEIWPALTARWPSAAATLSRVGQRMSEAREAIDALAAIDLDRVREADGTLSLAALAELSSARQCEVLMRWLVEAGAAPPDHRHLARMQAMMSAREHNSPRVCFADTEVRRFDGRFFVLPALGPPPRPQQLVDWPKPTAIALPEEAGTLAAYGVTPAVWPEGIQIGFRRGGERITLVGGRSRALKDVLREQRMPPWIRSRVPLVYWRDTLIAVADCWRHPEWARYFAGADVRLVWRHGLVGDRSRVVGDRPLG